MKPNMIKKLIASAIKVSKNSYSPYSHYQVGAALLTKSGKVFTGTNIENASYGSTICAERSAIFSAVSAGERELEAIAVYTKDGGFCCANCLQVMAEFAKSDFEIIIAKSAADYKIYKLPDMLPHPFVLK